MKPAETVRVRLPHAVDQRLQVALQCGKRGPQLVRHVRRETPTEGLLRSKGPRKVVHRQGNAIQLPHTGRPADEDIPVTLRNALRCGGNACEGHRDPPRRDEPMSTASAMAAAVTHSSRTFRELMKASSWSFRKNGP